MCLNSYNFNIIQGSTAIIQINAKDDNDALINLSGYSARGKIKEKYSNTGILLNLNPTVNSSFISGIVNISISGSLTAPLPIGEFPYDVEVFNIDESSVYKVAQGFVGIYPEVTN